MRGRIVIFHDDPDFLTRLADVLRRAGYAVLAYGDSGAAWDAISADTPIDLLITRLVGPAGKVPGLSLAQRLRYRVLAVHILFVDLPEYASFADGLGDILPAPVTPEEVARAATRILGRRPLI